jgi:hypothetical protein
MKQGQPGWRVMGSTSPRGLGLCQFYFQTKYKIAAAMTHRPDDGGSTYL